MLPKFFLLILILSGFSGAAQADISPAQYIGTGITPNGNSSIRMEKAEVDITYGSPCTLHAIFMMMNRSQKAEEVLVGFPMILDKKRVPDLEFHITFDGKSETVAAPSSKWEGNFWNAWVWYHCQHIFPPGITKVDVTTRFPISQSSGTSFKECLHYCIRSGQNWSGTIGEEVVRIHFPEPFFPEQITEIEPQGYSISGNSVEWQLKDFKPLADEYDVNVTFVRPDIMKSIIDLRAQHQASPQDVSLELRLVNTLLATGSYKSNSGFPPEDLSVEDYNSILRNIAGKKDQAIFIRHYKKKDKKSFQEIDSEWTPERTALIKILAEAGYRDEDSRSSFTLEAEAMLKHLLKEDPHNAKVWNVYLYNYWRFSFAALVHRFCQTVLSKAQAETIKEAVKNCPRDKYIQLWNKMVDIYPKELEKKDWAIFREGEAAL